MTEETKKEARKDADNHVVFVGSKPFKMLQLRAVH